jgi:hypothetical protein
MDQKRKGNNNEAKYASPFRRSKIQDAYEQMEDCQLHAWGPLCKLFSVKPRWLEKCLDMRGEALGLWRLEIDQSKKMARLIFT